MRNEEREREETQVATHPPSSACGGRVKSVTAEYGGADAERNGFDTTQVRYAPLPGSNFVPLTVKLVVKQLQTSTPRPLLDGLCGAVAEPRALKRRVDVAIPVDRLPKQLVFVCNAPKLMSQQCARQGWVGRQVGTT